ncbi:MAG TPA: low affinity iron permease family protein [Pseudolabrys sp.]|nr:low affinity iron permease family protein [Pseudolabrys sp.]
MANRTITRCEAAAIASAEQSVHRRSHPLTRAFAAFAQKTAAWTGHPVAFLLAAATILVWIVSGPVFGFSDTWQLIINTGTTIVTFLMVFLIQNTQNRDMLSMQLKLSELVLAMKGAENKFAAIEDLTDEELQRLHDDCRARAEMTAEQLANRSQPALATGFPRKMKDVAAE